MKAPGWTSVGDAARGEPPRTPEQNISVPVSVAWRPRGGAGPEGDGAASVHWDSDIEANHTPGGSRRQREQPSLARRMWDSLPSAAVVSTAAHCDGGADEGPVDDELSSAAWNWRKTIEGWELVAAFAAALMLVNGIALSHAAGPGITFLSGPSWAQPRSDLPDWTAQHRLYVDTLFRARQTGEEFQLLFYGDSILETFRGTSRGGPCAHCTGGPEVYAEHFGSKYRSEVFAISGDSVGNLMWRLEHGESPAGAGVRVIVLLIGANDLLIAAGDGPDALDSAVPRAASHIVSVVRRLLDDEPGARVLLMPVLPGGDYSQPLPQRLQYPNRYSTAVQRVNGIVRAELEQQRHVQWATCSYESILTTADGGSIREDLLPDGVHPTAPAWDALATACLDAPLAQLLDSD